MDMKDVRYERSRKLVRSIGEVLRDRKSIVVGGMRIVPKTTEGYEAAGDIFFKLSEVLERHSEN